MRLKFRLCQYLELALFVHLVDLKSHEHIGKPGFQNFETLFLGRRPCHNLVWLGQPERVCGALACGYPRRLRLGAPALPGWRSGMVSSDG